MLSLIAMRKRRYSGNGRDTMSNGEGIKRFAVLCAKRWGAKTLGIYADRDKRGRPGDLSVHALWRAADIRFDDSQARREACNWFVEHNHDLKIDLIVDYSYRGPMRRAYGRVWRCDTQKWRNMKKGETVGGGESWATFLHVELGYNFLTTNNGAAFESVWRSLPRP